MFLPLGLFLRLRTFPIITALLIVLCFVNHFLYDDSDEATKKITEIHKEFQVKKLVMLEKYCIDRGFDPLDCSRVNKEKVKVKDKKKIDSQKKQKNPFDSVDSALSALDLSTDIIILTRDFEDIVNEGLGDNSDISHLEGFREFQKDYQEHKKKFHAIAENYDLLTVENINLTSVLKAMFTHSGFFHLFGNMFALLVFGIYVEARIGALTYFASYMVSGFIGLSVYAYFLMSVNSLLVGASANVFGVLGMFYIFFRSVNMKFFVFYFVTKVIELPVKRYFFILFILLEIINTLVGGKNIAHGAHVAGLVAGVLIAYFWNQKYKLPEGFLYLSEVAWWRRIQKTKDLDKKVIQVGSLLAFNPFNIKVRALILNQIFENKDTALSKYKHFVNAELGNFLLRKYKEGQKEQVVKILSSIPMEIHLVKTLGRMQQKVLVELLDLAIEKEKYFLALRLIVCVCEKYPRSRQVKNYFKTAVSILDTDTIREEQINYLYESTTMRNVKELINTYKIRV